MVEVERALSGGSDVVETVVPLVVTALEEHTAVTPAAGDDIACTATNTQLPANLSLTKTASPSTVVAGKDVTYTLVARNAGPSSATNVVVTDALPAGLTFVSASNGCTAANATVTCTAASLVSVRASQGSCTKTTPVITCSLGTIRSGGKVTITVVAMPKSTGTLLNSASVTSDDSDPRTSNNIDGVSGTVTKPLMKVTKVANHTSVKAGQSIKYTIRVTNPTGLPVADVWVCDNLPSGLVYVSSKPKAKLSKGQQCWTAKSVGAHKTISYTLTARALAGTAGTKTNTATVSGPAIRPATRDARCGSPPAPSERAASRADPPDSRVSGARPPARTRRPRPRRCLNHS